MRIPGSNHLATFDLIRIIYGQFRTVRDTVTFPVNAVLVMNYQLAGSGNNNIAAILALDGTDAHPGDRALILDLDTAGGSDSRSGTTDVEGPHGQLCAWLPNTLCRHHTNGLATTNKMAPGQITAIAGCADTVARLAGHRGSHIEMIDIVLFEQFDTRFIDHLAGAKELGAVTRTHDIFRYGTTQNAILQGNHHFTALNDGLAQDALGSAAVIFSNDQVLTDVDQTTGQITRVRGLERCISQALACAVGRNKVFVDVQSFAEVSRDRSLNNGAVRFCHQTAHTGKLADLRVTSSGAGISHHVNGVERLLFDRLTLGVDNFLHAQLVHHFTGYPVGRMRPDIDDFVVAFAIGQ